MKNFLKIFAFICLACVMLVNCKDMNYLHDKYMKDGEIIYVALFDSMHIYSGINRLVIHYWLSDPQVKHVDVTWEMGLQSKKLDVGLTRPDNPGIIEIPDLKEGSISFEIYNFSDDYSDRSVASRFTRYIYGDRYMTALNNRLIKDYTYAENGTVDITWVLTVHEGTIGTEIKYITSSGEERTDTIAKAEDLIETANAIDPSVMDPPKFQNKTQLLDVMEFSVLSYRVLYIPQNSCDILTSYTNSIEIRGAIRVTGLTVEKNIAQVCIGTPLTIETTVEPPEADNQTVTWQSSMPNVVRVTPEGEITGVSEGYGYVVATSEDGSFEQRILIKVNQAGYYDLDRTNWYAAPETHKDTGEPLTGARDSEATAPATSSITNPITVNKNKSPYLSHPVAWSNSGLPGSGDADNNPTAHFDNRSGTYLAMVKGIGSDGTTYIANGWDIGGGPVPPNTWAGFHRYNGVGLYDENDKPWFIIRLDENTPQKFNYFSMRFRENGGNANLTPWAATFYGSNDDNCINDHLLWATIANGNVIDLNNFSASVQPVFPNFNNATNNDRFQADEILESGNRMLHATETYEYRYIKVQFERWAVGSNNLCVAEFYLGLKE